MKYIWLSFSLKGKNQGACNVRANSEEQALNVCAILDIIPISDNILALPIPEPELELDKLIGFDELKSKGFSDTFT